MIYGYARVSTKYQLTDGNSLENQFKLLKENGAEEIFSDNTTGRKIDRPNFNKLVKKMKKGDTLIVTKLDRVARSTIEGSILVDRLINNGIKINILNIGIMDNTPSSKLIRNIFFSFAEFEREMIIERTQEGKAIARTRKGYKEGRPKRYTKEQLDHALSLLSVNGGYNSYKDVERIIGISKSTLIRENKRRREEKLKSER